MSPHRRSRRVIGIAFCLAVLAATTGCRRSPFHRLGEDRPIGPNGKPVGFQPPTSPLDQTKAVPALKPPAPVSAIAAAQPDGPVLGPARTPMLDAALARIEAVEADHRRIMRAEAKAEADAVAAKTAARKPTLVAVSKSVVGPKRDDAVQRASVAVGTAPSAPPIPIDKTKLWKACADVAEMLPADLSAVAVPAALPRAIAQFVPAAASKPAEAPAFSVDTVQLCRKINGFGSFETMDAETLKAGGRFIIYCELAGLRYDRRDDGDGYISRVSTHIELIDARDGSTAWEVLGEAEDRCQSRRRDAFVGTRVHIPEDLPPGAYTIRLTQTDALADKTATSEVAVTITR